MTSEPITAAAAGTWKLGDLTVNRMGFGAMRLTGGTGRVRTGNGARRPSGYPGAQSG
jgi:hypothetical protein